MEGGAQGPRPGGDAHAASVVCDSRFVLGPQDSGDDRTEDGPRSCRVETRCPLSGRRLPVFWWCVRMMRVSNMMAGRGVCCGCLCIMVTAALRNLTQGGVYSVCVGRGGAQQRPYQVTVCLQAPKQQRVPCGSPPPSPASKASAHRLLELNSKEGEGPCHGQGHPRQLAGAVRLCRDSASRSAPTTPRVRRAGRRLR